MDPRITAKRWCGQCPEARLESTKMSRALDRSQGCKGASTRVKHESFCYASNMSSTGVNEFDPVHGLVDAQRAAHMLGVDARTFHVWATRSKTAKSGIPAAMPKPVATMNGHIYRLEDIETFGRHIALNARGPRTVERGRGAYFTPDRATKIMSAWALRSWNDTVLEPSLGDGRFALAIQQVARERGWGGVAIHAAELDPDTAQQVVANGLELASLHTGDFLDHTALPKVDVAIGNPPYVRVRELDSTLSRNAMAAASAAMHQPMDPAGSVWMPFVAKATNHLRRGGRLAFVLPLDFTYVRYARPLWTFLARSFGRLQVLRFRERVFPDILQNVLILLADDRGGVTETVELLAHEQVADLPAGEIRAGVPISLENIVNGDRAFLRALLPQVTLDALEALVPHTEHARQRLKFNIGYVSGSKQFFHPTPEIVRSFRLPEASLLPTIGSSRQLSRRGLRTSVIPVTEHLWLPGERPTQGERDYVAHGEKEGIDMAYKCRIRTPWYRVPGVRTPDVVLTTFSDLPRLHVNDAGWTASNSVLGGTMRTGQDPLTFACSWYTPLTQLSAELEVHSLGGGVMIAVPKEADAVQVLTTGSTRSVDPTQLTAALESTDRTAAYRVGDQAIADLIGRGGLEAIQLGADTLTAWRRG